MLEKGWNPRLSEDKLSKDFIDSHPTESNFKFLLDKVKHSEKQSMNDTFDYAQQKWKESHKVPNFKKLEDSYVGPFVIVSLHGTNAVQVELGGELENKHPTIPVILMKTYQPADKELFPLRNTTPLTVPPVEQIEDKTIMKATKEGILRVKIKEKILSDIEIQYMKMNGWDNQR
ncbi:hypothetical protein O181_058774 [Austropuccinia psidii MF-1]|uniref:Uncharacterized protein n=1 Tax=Austropuccinia psidii MF-1 TaxID=1389203 RepID=A0A9Q3ED08_9BASI|nr:hypothetical protein [Austropuccinia psidii MF-1]